MNRSGASDRVPTSPFNSAARRTRSVWVRVAWSIHGGSKLDVSTRVRA
ncbi:MAG: hypothetical protein AAF366_11330 [Pseudomonadota bacterium]